MIDKYELLKDSPDAKAGEIYTQQKDKPNWYLSTSNSCYHASIIEDNPEWFRKIEERVQITINGTPNDLMFHRASYTFTVYNGYRLPTEKIPLVKKAIELVLNDESFGIRLYTKQELEDSFNAARERDGIPMNPVNPPPFIKYPTFQDYFKNIKK